VIVDLKFQCEELKIQDCFTGDLFLLSEDLWEIINKSNGIINARTTWAGKDHVVESFSSETLVLRVLSKAEE
jgi:hypothetical protein|tara:strand:+ start:165 stop:380 length:216 start_codon:yes stop_codon:yes gene_type:complete